MNYQQLHSPAARTVQVQRVIPMDERCAFCGLRYGMHKVHTLTCPNPTWRPGNGQPQWLVKKFKPAT